MSDSNEERQAVAKKKLMAELQTGGEEALTAMLQHAHLRGRLEERAYVLRHLRRVDRHFSKPLDLANEIERKEHLPIKP